MSCSLCTGIAAVERTSAAATACGARPTNKVGAVGRAGVAIQTARCAALLRRRGVKAGLVTCDGRLPVIHSGGTCRLGRVALRGITAPVELGALPEAVLTIGDNTFVNQGASIV